MMKWIGGGVAIVMAALGLLAAFANQRASALANQVAALESKTDRLLKQTENLNSVIKAYAESERGQVQVVERTQRVKEYIDRQPVTTGCGPVVHDTIEQLRNQKD